MIDKKGNNESLMSRRNFLRLCGAGLAAAELAVLGHSMRSIKEISTDDETCIDQSAGELVPRISLEGFDREFLFEEDRVRVIPQKKELAVSLLRVAHRDGGKEETEKVAKFFEERGLILSSNTFLSGDGEYMGSQNDLDPARISVGERTLRRLYRGKSSIVLRHEEVHAAQQGRNPDLHETYSRAKLLAYCVGSTGLGGYTFVDSLMDRRGVVQSIGFGVAGFSLPILFKLLGGVIEPHEQEAYIRSTLINLREPDIDIFRFEKLS